MATQVDVLANFIDGELLPSAGETEAILNPATGEEMARAPVSSAEEVDRALKACAQAGRFQDGDLARVLSHQQTSGELILFPARSEESSLQRSTRSWEGFGR